MKDAARNEIQKLETEIYELTLKLNQLRKDSVLSEVKNYSFQSLEGKVSLLELFSGKEVLFLIHNMGQGCRYCTTWGDGLNGFLPHLENKFAVALASKDMPDVQRTFANSRGWRFKMVSHQGTDYLKENDLGNSTNTPGIVCYVRQGERIFRKNSSVFGPGDQFCSLWSVLSLAGFDENSWTPQFNYWQRPEKLDDGGKNIK